MYTILMTNDNRMTTTVSERIVQRSKNVHTVRLLVLNEYYGRNMNECCAIMFYKLPVSQEWKSIELIPSEELYKEKYVEYQFSADTWLTAEAGDVELEVKFYNVSLNGTINVDQYVRKVTDGVIHISSSKDWASGIADSALDTLDQRIIQLMMVQNRQEEMMAESQMNCPDSLAVTDGKIHLVNKDGIQKGEAVDIVLPRVPDTEDGSNDGLIELGYVEFDDEDSSEENGNFSEL